MECTLEHIDHEGHSLICICTFKFLIWDIYLEDLNVLLTSTVLEEQISAEITERKED